MKSHIDQEAARELYRVLKQIMESDRRHDGATGMTTIAIDAVTFKDAETVLRMVGE